jgi:hypothetical protein
MSEFHELRGDYVENAGQQINLQGYLDYFEPLGSALSRLPDGTGGPFVYQFTAGGGRTIGAIGWVVSAASKRFGGWKLWGMWAERPIPAIALPLFWPSLSDPSQVGQMVARANDDAGRLFDRGQWRDLAAGIKPARLRDRVFRELLMAELALAYAAKKQPIEVELTPPMLDLLPWLYVLGPVDPTQAQIQPSRFNGAGYQYIVSDREPLFRDAEIPAEVEKMVDAAAGDAARGWGMANALRDRRTRPPRPKPKLMPAPAPLRLDRFDDEETTDMPTRKPPLDVPALLQAALQLLVIVLLAWILWEVRAIRKNTAPRAPEPAAITTSAPVPAPAPVVEENPIRDLARALVANPPTGIRVGPAALDESRETLARVAVEVFMRRNNCFNRAEAVDGKISAAEQRAIRTCTSLRNERLVSTSGQIDVARAIAWLERTLR